MTANVLTAAVVLGCAAVLAATVLDDRRQHRDIRPGLRRYARYLLIYLCQAALILFLRHITG